MSVKLHGGVANGGDKKYEMDKFPFVDEASLTSYKRKMKAVELPNSIFKKEVYLTPIPPPSLHDRLHEKANVAVDALDGSKPQRPRVRPRIQEEVSRKLMLTKEKKDAKKRKENPKEKRRKSQSKTEKKELNITEWRKEQLPVFSTKLVFPLAKLSPSPNKSYQAPEEAMRASMESSSVPEKAMRASMESSSVPEKAMRASMESSSVPEKTMPAAKLRFSTLSKILPKLKMSTRGQMTPMLTLERPADEIASISSNGTAQTSFTRTAGSCHPSISNHGDVESDGMMGTLPVDPYSVSNNASSPDEEREICSIHLSLEPAEMKTPRPYTLSERLTKDHQSRSNNACTQNDKAEKEVHQQPFRAKMSRTILETLAQQIRLLEQLRRKKWCPRQVSSSNPVTTFSSLLGLLVHDTNPDVLAQVCGYLLNLKRHFFIPKSFLRKSATLVLRVLKSSDDVQVQRVCLYILPQLTLLRYSVLLVVFPTLVNFDQGISLETAVDPLKGLSVQVTSTMAEQVEFLHGQTEETDRKSSDEVLIGLQHQTPLLVTRHSETSPSGPPGPKDTSAASTLLPYRHQDAPSSPPSHHSRACSTDSTQGRVLSDGGGLDGRRAAVNTRVFMNNVNIPSFHSFAVSSSSFQIRRKYLHITRNSSYLIIKSENIRRKLPFVSGESSHVTSGYSQVAPASSRIIRESARLVEARLYPSTRDHEHGKQPRRCQFPLKVFVSREVFSTEVPDLEESNDLTDERVIYVWDSLPQYQAVAEARLYPSTRDHEHGKQGRRCQFPLKDFVSKVFSTEVPDPEERNDLTDERVINIRDSLPQSQAVAASSDVPNKALEIVGTGNKPPDVRKKTRVKSKPVQHVRGDNSTQLRLPKGLLIFNPTMEHSFPGRQNEDWTTMPTRRPFQRLPASTNALRIPHAVGQCQRAFTSNLSGHVLASGRPVAMAKPHTSSPAGASQRRVLHRKTETRLLGVLRNRQNHINFTSLPMPQDMSLTSLPKPQDMGLTRLPKPLDKDLTRLRKKQYTGCTRLTKPQCTGLNRVPCMVPKYLMPVVP